MRAPGTARKADLTTRARRRRSRGPHRCGPGVRLAERAGCLEPNREAAVLRDDARYRERARPGLGETRRAASHQHHPEPRPVEPLERAERQAPQLAGGGERAIHVGEDGLDA